MQNKESLNKSAIEESKNSSVRKLNKTDLDMMNDSYAVNMIILLRNLGKISTYSNGY